MGSQGLNFKNASPCTYVWATKVVALVEYGTLRFLYFFSIAYKGILVSCCQLLYSALLVSSNSKIQRVHAFINSIAKNNHQPLHFRPNLDIILFIQTANFSHSHIVCSAFCIVVRKVGSLD